MPEVGLITNRLAMGQANCHIAFKVGLAILLLGRLFAIRPCDRVCRDPGNREGPGLKKSDKNGM